MSQGYVVDRIDWADCPDLPNALGNSFEETGFAVILNPPVPSDALLQRGYNLAREVFALPAETLRRYETPDNGRQTGYTSYGIEKAKGSDTTEHKHFWHARMELPPDHPIRQHPKFVDNLFPEEVPGFADFTQEYLTEALKFGRELLAALDAFYQFPDGVKLADMLCDYQTLLRVLHYPYAGPNPGGIRAEAHEDINLLTLLPAATRPGLELLLDGQWRPVLEPPGSLTVNFGDMLKLLLRCYLPKRKAEATTHRVVNPQEGDEEDRLSMPIFLHPKRDTVLDPSRNFTAGQFLDQRLREIRIA